MKDESIGSSLNVLKNQFQDLINGVTPIVKELLDESTQGINENSKKMIDKGIAYVKGNPLAALLSAFSLGFLLTAWLKRK